MQLPTADFAGSVDEVGTVGEALPGGEVPM